MTIRTFSVTSMVRALSITGSIALAALSHSVLAVGPPEGGGGPGGGGNPNGGGGSSPLTQITNFGTNPGNLQMFEYVPTTVKPSAPVLVAIHGCTQSADEFDDESGWMKLADQWGFILVLPEQQKKNNPLRCFNWFGPNDQNRGGGEALSIQQMVDYVKANATVDDQRVFVTGFSAGGAMTAVMLATYPDVFHGGGIVAGVPYKCAESATGPSASTCQSSSADKTPQEWGDLVRNTSSHTGPWPKVSLWHGDADTSVTPLNMTELMDQWTNVNGIDQYPDVQETVQGYPHEVYTDVAGNALVETYLLSGLEHAVAINPGASTDQCGIDGTYFVDWNICSSYYIGSFLGLDQ